jgi:hypothetical protein
LTDPSITGDGIGLRWEKEDIDISLKGILTKTLLGGLKQISVDGENNYALSA